MTKDEQKKEQVINTIVKWHADVLREKGQDEAQLFCINRAKNDPFYKKPSEEQISEFEAYLAGTLEYADYHFTVPMLFHFGDSYVQDERSSVLVHLGIYSAPSYFSDVFVTYGENVHGHGKNSELLKFTAFDYSISVQRGNDSSCQQIEATIPLI